MNPSTVLAHVLVDELVRCGVREAVLCPGSRSAPLAYALEQADREGRLRLHVRVDERSAAFLALGLAKVSRVPAVVVTTSGTAVANLHPAVLEAHHAAVPLIVVSADRPAELLGTGANQTTDQPGLFGAAPRWSAVVPAPDGSPDAATRQHPGWRTTADRAFAAAVGALGTAPGPVHLDVQLREPLVPDDAGSGGSGGAGSGGAGGAEPGGAGGAASGGTPAHSGSGSPDLDPAVASVPAGRPDGAPWTRVENAPVTTSAPGPAPDPARTLVLLGDLPGPDDADRAVRWAGRHGWPVVAEPFGAHDRTAVVPAGSLLLTDTDWVEAHRPDRVVTVGRLTLSRHVAALVRHPGTRVETVSAVADWADPSHAVAAVHPLAVLDHPAAHPGTQSAGGGAADDGAEAREHGRAGGWAETWHEAGARLVASSAAADLPWPSGLAVATTVLAHLPTGATLFAASSNAARDLDLAPVVPPHPLRITASRGLAGIDGTLSTASGIAMAAGSGPAYVLVGDLAFLHDASALVIGPAEPRPDLTVVLVNDDGGGIFGLLEPGDPARPDLAASFERVFGTPTRVDVAALCGAHGVPHVVADSAQALAAQLQRPPSGLRVVEVRVGRDGHRAVHARLRTHAQSVLADRP